MVKMVAMVKNGHVYEMGKEFKTLAGQLQTQKILSIFLRFNLVVLEEIHKATVEPPIPNWKFP